jgi:O-methyltransferase
MKYKHIDLPLVSNMVTEQQLEIILNELSNTSDVEGDVVELGCNIGTTSIFIQSMLTGKQFHVYDSFEGLPDKDTKDTSLDTKNYYYDKGSCYCTEGQFKNTFVTLKLPLPIIHKGWFSDQVYPESISFAFFDGDFYSSIKDSLELIYPRLRKGAIVCIHDYGWPPLPGVKLACDEFLKDKPETITSNNFVGIMKKQ